MVPISQLLVGLIAAILWISGGCAGPSGFGRGGSLASVRRPYTPDIPLPTGFRMVDPSEALPEGGGAIRLRHRYRGWGRGEAIRRFYRLEMPRVRWILTDDRLVKGRYVMRFERDGERCVITIVNGAPLLLRQATVDVVVSLMVNLSAQRPAMMVKSLL